MIESYDDLKRTIAHAMCKRRNTGECAAICLTYFNHSICPEELNVFNDDAKAIADALLNKMIIYNQ